MKRLFKKISRLPTALRGKSEGGKLAQPGGVGSDLRESETLDEVIRREERALRPAIEASLDAKLLRLSVVYKPVKTYSIEDPWARVIILQHKDTGEYLYYVNEVEMNKVEQDTYNRIMEILNWELRHPTEEELKTIPGTTLAEKEREFLIRQIKRIVNIYRIKMASEVEEISWSKILYYMIRNNVGYGPLDVLIKDEYLEDISCDGVGRPVYVWHQEYESIKSNIVFEDERQLDHMILLLAHRAGKHISVAFPVLDAVLPEGHRVAATFRREVSTQGSTFTIRKFKATPLSIVDLIIGGTISPDIAAYLWLMAEYRMPGIIMGVTGSGKTTTLNAIATLLRPNVKIVTIEDTPEIKLPHENWVQLVSRPSFSVTGESRGEISLYDLVRVSLRYRPDVIIVGEVRGEEAYVLFQALATGHGGLTTIHSETIEAMIRRLTSPPMNIPEGYIPLVKFALAVKRVRLPDPASPEGHRIARKVTDVWEITGPSSEDAIEVARWNPFTKEHEHFMEKSVAIAEIGKLVGLTKDEVLSEIERRKLVLIWMAKSGIRRYREVAPIIFKYYYSPDDVYERAAKELKTELL
ncbi:type II/IV secretion system ATPase subunit [Aeropyrum pernix]|uniref:type II/IV secretion system ATPase subunit n=1 Tax=Aeropyrum pernix TaxID=56636 RepID=UPI0010374A02|nr:type II/IV secretion system ATPase subunit [Aeropyrum pernix]